MSIPGIPARARRVPCVVDLEATHDHFHAHVDLGAVEVGPGDSVLVADTPTHIRFGERRRYPASATVRHAGPLARAWLPYWMPYGFHGRFQVA